MSDAPRGRGRGRGKRTIGGVTLNGGLTEPTASPSPAPEPRSRTSTSASASATPVPQDVQMEDAPTGERSTPQPARASSLRRVPSVGVASSRAPSVGVGSSRDRVGGLLGSQSQFKGAGAGGATGKPKFKPNVAAAAARRKGKEQQYSDDEDVKMEDDGWKKRGPRAPRPRQELEMTASGPMAQGPGGAPRAWGARAATASGAAVMAASREGTLNAQLNQDEDASDLEGAEDDSDSGGGGRRMRIRATDLNDIGLSDGGSDDEEGKGVPPLVLPRDPKVLRTKIRRLQERKTERLKKEALKAGDQVQVKDEPKDDTMSIDGTPNATPGPSEAKSMTFDSKESTFAGFDLDEKDAKDLKDLEEEEKKEINLSEAFDFKDNNRLDLYMFQFPRKFPTFVPQESPKLDNLSLSDSKKEEDSDSDSSSEKKPIKPDPDASQTSSAAARKPVPPDWGRSGTRTQKAARWSEESGKIGKLRVHRSGKVTLKLNGDLKYEVLPAAQPSFLQEIAVLDHPLRTKKKDENGASLKKKKGKSSKSSKGKKKKGKDSIFDAKKPKNAAKGSSDEETSEEEDEDEEDSSSSESSDDSDDDQPKWNKKDPPPNSLVCIGQTSKKFIVVPEITDLLEKVGKQEEAEKKADREARLAKLGVKKETGSTGKMK